MRRIIKPALIAGAALLMTVGAQQTSMAAGWKLEMDGWHYYLSDGSMVTDSFRLSGGNYYYLDENGDMATNRLIEHNGNYYYVNSGGIRVANEWRRLYNEDAYDEDEYEYSWYYFRADGRACRAPDSGRTVFLTIPVSTGGSKQYAFDERGRMLYGWVDDNAGRLTGEDAWRSGVYYCGGPEDGARVSEAWRELEVNDEDVADEYGNCWFYFQSNGRKLSGVQRRINDKWYLFHDDGTAQYLWYTDQTAEASQANASHSYYNSSERCWLATGWFKTVPPEDVDPEACAAGEEYWFYGLSRGGVVTSQIKYIGGHRYGFNEKGEMLHGLYLLDMDEDGGILSYRRIEDEWMMPDEDDAGEVYYFGDSPKEGVMATGKTTVRLYDESYSYRFKTSGPGVTGISDNCIYIKGRQLKPDEWVRYGTISYGGSDYLVNASGRIQKNRKNARDTDGCYYSSDGNGIVTYRGYEKQS